MEEIFEQVNNTETPKPIPADKTQSIPGCMDGIVLFIVGIGISSVVFIRHLSVHGTTIVPENAPKVAALIGIGIQFILVTPLLIALALFWPTYQRKTYQAWLLAQFLTLILAVGYFINPTATQLQALIQIILCLIFLIVASWLIRVFSSRDKDLVAGQMNPRIRTTASLWLILVNILVIAAYPWLAIGALGSILDTLLMVSLGVMIGYIAGTIYFYMLPGSNPERNSWGEILVNCFGFSILLLMLGSSLSFSYSGVQLMIMLMVPIAGWLTVLIEILIFPGNRKLTLTDHRFFSLREASPISLFIGLLTALPLIFLDPDELILLLGNRIGEIISNGFQASLYTSLILFIFALLIVLILIVRSVLKNDARRPILSPKVLNFVNVLLAFILIAGLFGAFIIYWTIGQPGLHGDRIFVILKNQADLTGIAQISDYSERRKEVFNRLVQESYQSQIPIRKVLDRFNLNYTAYYLVNGLDVQGSPIIRLWLSTRPEVDRILENPVLRPLSSPLSSQSGNAAAPDGVLWNISTIQADRVWEEFGVKGTGIVIGQSDSGVQGDHPELSDSYRGRSGQDDYNWFDPWNHSEAPTDIGGHGTHTLGTVLGNRTGIAPDAEWIGCVNLARNLGNPAHYLDCMQFTFAPYPRNGDPFEDGDPSLGAHILNNSWGCPEIEGCDALVFQPAVKALREAGVFFVASAGNEGPSCGSLNVPPPIYAEVFAVGAMDQFREIAFFSSIGPVSADQSNRVKPDIIAPGVGVLSSLPGNSYGEFSGTSMAGPHVAGTVALMWSANPGLIGNIDATEELLIESVDPYEGNFPQCPGVDQIPSTATGFGILNSYKAVQLAVGYK